MLVDDIFGPGEDPSTKAFMNSSTATGRVLTESFHLRLHVTILPRQNGHQRCWLLQTHTTAVHLSLESRARDHTPQKGLTTEGIKQKGSAVEMARGS